MTRDWTSTVNTAVFLENGQEVYPCRCGQTHRGDYALYDWMHHECFHEADLLRFPVDPDLIICPDCGMSWKMIRA